MMQDQDDELEYIRQLTTIMRTHGVTYLKNSRVEITVPPVIPERPREEAFSQQSFKEAEMPISMAMWGMKNGA